MHLCRLILFVVQTAVVISQTPAPFGEYNFKNSTSAFHDNSLILPKVKCSYHTESNRSAVCSNGAEPTCPPGLFCKEGHCECGVYPDSIVLCNNQSPLLQSCNCATFNCERKQTVIGKCLYTCGVKSDQFYFYHPLPNTAKGLSDVCRKMNRGGVLCGRCLPNFYPLAYSYNMSCVPCPNVRWNWVKYIVSAYVPLTLFYLIVLFFRVNVTSSYLYAIVTYFQFLALPALVRLVLRDFKENTNTAELILAKVVFSFCGIWNLDFFRPFYSHLCLGMGILPTLALDYAIAVYPLLLMVITYLLIELHDRNYRIVTRLWSPVRKLFTLFKSNWDIRTSIIDAFATFFLLSNVKFLSVSFDLLVPTKVYKLHSIDRYDYYLGLYYSQDIYYFVKNEHLPYAVLAIAVMCVFVCMPLTILTLYPFLFFRRFLDFLPFNLHVILHTFMDSFLGCYKDGTEPGTRDCRWFSTFQFHLRITFFIAYALATNVVLFLFMSMSLIGVAILVVTVRPYRSSVGHYNTITAVSMLLLAIMCLIPPAIDLSVIYMNHIVPFLYALIALLACSSVLYGVGIAVHWIYRKRKFRHNFIQRVREWRHGYKELKEAN